MTWMNEWVEGQTKCAPYVVVSKVSLGLGYGIDLCLRRHEILAWENSIRKLYKSQRRRKRGMPRKSSRPK